MWSALRNWLGRSSTSRPPSQEDDEVMLKQWSRDWVGPVDWGRFYDHSLIRRWANELVLTRQAGSAEAWLICGSNLLLVGDEVETLSELVQMAASEADFRYLRVPAAGVPDLMDTPRRRFESLAPAVVQLDAGDWCATEDVTGLISSRSTGWRSVWQAIDAQQPVVFVLCVQEADGVHEEWRKFGAFDRCVQVQSPGAAFLGRRFLAWLEGYPLDATMVASQQKIGLMLQSEFPTVDSQQLAALHMKRLATSQRRPLLFDDLANLALRGAAEFSVSAVKPSSEAARRKTAYHEAGHACIAVIESKGLNVPDYCSIVPARDFAGIVMQSLNFLDSMEEFTFENLLLRTRVALAGRAAEEIYFGPGGISSGANTDLSNATRLSFRMFAHAGFHPLMELGQSTAANLAVIPQGEIGELQSNRIHREVRQFLATQYDHVVKTLQLHRPFVDSVAARLLWDPVIDQQELTQMALQFGLYVPPSDQAQGG